FVPDFAPARMITKLFPPARVPSSRLQMAIGIGADPHLRPRRRDREGFDAAQYFRIGHRFSRGMAITKILAAPLALDPRLFVVHITKADGARRNDRILERLHGLGFKQGNHELNAV